MPAETTRELIERRWELIRETATEAIRLEVAWLRRHNFPIWVARDGRIVDAREEGADTDAPAPDEPTAP